MHYLKIKRDRDKQIALHLKSTLRLLNILIYNKNFNKDRCYHFYMQID